MVQLLRSQAMRWRTLAIFITFGLLVNVVVGALFAAGIATTVSRRTASVFLWLPPALDERLLPMLHTIAQLRPHTALIFGFLALHMLIVILLAIGLWKSSKWAAWITTAIVVLKVALDAFAVVPVMKGGTSLDWLITLGWIPAFVWFAVYLLLLWADWIIGRVRSVTTLVNSLRRERVPLNRLL